MTWSDFHLEDRRGSMSEQRAQARGDGGTVVSSLDHRMYNSPCGACPARVAARLEAPFSEASCVRPAPYIHDLIPVSPTVWESPQEETGS